jgi:hypothetical protein
MSIFSSRREMAEMDTIIVMVYQFDYGTVVTRSDSGEWSWEG